MRMGKCQGRAAGAERGLLFRCAPGTGSRPQPLSSSRDHIATAPALLPAPGDVMVGTVWLCPASPQPGEAAAGTELPCETGTTKRGHVY